MSGAAGKLNLASPSSEITTGLFLMFLSVLASPLIDIFSKLATATVPAAEVTAGRFIFQSLFMLPMLLRPGIWNGFHGD